VGAAQTCVTARLFVYGQLRSGRESAHVVARFAGERITKVRVRGRLRLGRAAVARARFDADAETAVLGDLLELYPDHVGEALSACTRFYGEGYRLVTVDVEADGETLSAQAFEWAGELDDPQDYAAAAVTDVKIAHYHCHALSALGQEDPYERLMFQAHSDGVLTSGEAAAGYLACALDLLLGYGLEPVTPRLLLDEASRRGEQRFAAAIGAFGEWLGDPIVRDASELVRRPTRYHFEKAAKGWHWAFDEVELRGDGEPYVGPRSVLGYCVRYVAHLDLVERAAVELQH
jgi:hypothetical protein